MNAIPKQRLVWAVRANVQWQTSIYNLGFLIMHPANLAGGQDALGWHSAKVRYAAEAPDLLGVA